MLIPVLGKPNLLPSPGPVSRFTDQVFRFWSGCCCQIICLLSGSWSRLQLLLYILLLLSAVAVSAVHPVQMSDALVLFLSSGQMYLVLSSVSVLVVSLVVNLVVSLVVWFSPVVWSGYSLTDAIPL